MEEGSWCSSSLALFRCGSITISDILHTSISTTVWTFITDLKTDAIIVVFATHRLPKINLGLTSLPHQSLRNLISHCRKSLESLWLTDNREALLEHNYVSYHWSFDFRVFVSFYCQILEHVLLQISAVFLILVGLKLARQMKTLHHVQWSKFVFYLTWNFLTAQVPGIQRPWLKMVVDWYGFEYTNVFNHICPVLFNRYWAISFPFTCLSLLVF